MAIPHTCPTCKGDKVLLGMSAGTVPDQRPCPTCFDGTRSTGVVWETTVADVASSGRAAWPQVGDRCEKGKN